MVYRYLADLMRLTSAAAYSSSRPVALPRPLRQLMEGKDLSSGGDKAADELKKRLAAAEKERDSALKKAEALQCQAESTSREYDRLMTEHESLQRRAGETAETGKKDD